MEFPRASQASNPEVYVCVQYPSKFQREIRLLQYMTREMNSLTGTCSSDDEDCIDPPPTTLYYDLDAIDLTLGEPTSTAQPTEESGVVSGSGEDDICQPVVTTQPPTLPTVGVGSTEGSPGVGVSSTGTGPGVDGELDVTDVIVLGPGITVNAQSSAVSSTLCASGLTLTLSAVLVTALAFLDSLHLITH